MKKFLSFVLAAVMLLSLAACGKKDDIPADDSQSSSFGLVGDNMGQPSVVDDIGGDKSNETLPPDESDPAGDFSEVGQDGEVQGDSSEDESQVVDTDTQTPDDGETEGEGDGEGEGEEEPAEVDPHKLDTEAGEVAISSGVFEDGVATEQAIRDLLHVNGSQVSYEVCTAAVELLNTYSKEGIIRFVEETTRFSGVSEDVKNATVLVYRILDLPMEQLYEEDFMSERLVNVVVDVLDYAQEQFEQQEQDNNKKK